MMPDRPALLSFSCPDTAGSARVWQHRLAPLEGVVYVYATFPMGPANPIPFSGRGPVWASAPDDGSSGRATGPTRQDEVEGGFVVQELRAMPTESPQFLQTVALGRSAGDEFLPVVRFGLADDRRAEGMAHVTAWAADGHLDHFGPYARPGTPWDFKLRLDLARGRWSAWVSGRGDDDWFLLVDDLPLHGGGGTVDSLRVGAYPGGPPIEDLRVQPAPWRAGERVRPHPHAKKDRAVGPRCGFRFQAMRSTWRRPGKHVTIFREPGVHCAFPDVALAGADHLVCVWRNGSHTGGTGGLSLAHSRDLGRTWSAPVLVTPLRGNCPRLQRLGDGSLLLLVDVPSSGDQFTAVWDLVMWDSVDGGYTWTGERWLRAGMVGGGGGIVPSGICELADGSWLLTASYFAPPPTGGRYVEILDYYRSPDRGRTWEFVGQPNHYPPYCLSEPSLVPLPDGRLVVYARESRTDGMPGAKGYSSDGGSTWEYLELPHPITGRTCAARLRSGQVMNTFRSGIGRAALRAWIGDPDDRTGAQPAGGHCNDQGSVGLKDGALHIDNDGRRGQFTKYTLRPPDTEKSVVDLSFEVQVLANQGRAATVSIPFAGRLRLFPERAELAHEPALGVPVAPGLFHRFRVLSQVGRMRLYVDGELALDTDRADSRLRELPWTQASPYALEFGNEARGSGAKGTETASTIPDVYLANISAEVTGYSIWRSFAVVLDDPGTGRRQYAWEAARDGFPDQHQLDHILEVEASANGHDQGYSGWVELDDGRVFVVHYTDDTSAASTPNPHSFGVPWIRGTFVEPADMPPAYDRTGCDRAARRSGRGPRSSGAP